MTGDKKRNDVTPMVVLITGFTLLAILLLIFLMISPLRNTINLVYVYENSYLLEIDEYRESDCLHSGLCPFMKEFVTVRNIYSSDSTDQMEMWERIQTFNNGKEIQYRMQTVMQTAIKFNEVFRNTGSYLLTTPVAVIIEGRTEDWDLESLEYVIENAIQTLPLDWRIHVYVAAGAVEKLQKSLFFFMYAQLSSKIYLHVMPCEMKLNKILYNTLISQKVFWDSLAPASHVHLIEQDSGYCQNSQMKITQYLQYDYCGAVWPNVPCDDNISCVGNSGFSIWNRHLMSDLTSRFTLPEGRKPDGSPWLIDEFWGDIIRKNSTANICPQKAARYFSSETVHDIDIIPIGWHKPYFNQWSPQVQTHFSKVCPSYHKITYHTTM